MSDLARTLRLQSLPIRTDVWPAHALAHAPLAVVPTGDAGLDAELPAGGWPLGKLSEILQPVPAHNEWRVVLPALVRQGAGVVVLVGAPHQPFIPALQSQGLLAQRLLQVESADTAQRLWATEQALQCSAVDAVLAWLPRAQVAPLRRLHMMALGQDKLLFVMRPQDVQSEASPAPLRLSVQPAEQGPWDAVCVRVFKRRGPPMSSGLVLQPRHAQLRLVCAAQMA